ncbi:PucR family transcriptional regulator [Actinomadura sp. DC4]|uniref:PucR family transcriptional regulator n=1 Tax=Actinomadura sp. DC4 TaxID=3055069 RepID=UPI0025B2521E|nr:PucR family transcriptional regulator [Actinomadura sp. DC4]MDN3357853.1 helix-turn-helix domain-containing protein [Actinomadura sp. DC4]
MWLEQETGRRELAGLLRSEMDGLAGEICAEISEAVPEYATPCQCESGPVMRPAVEQAIVTFVDRIAEPSASSRRLIDVYRLLGQNEAHHDRNLNALQAAFRVAFRVAWHRTTNICARHELPSEIVAGLAEAQLEYMDELASISVEGYLEASAHSPEELAELRLRLLRLILERPAAPRQAITELAGRADWTVPAEVTPVVVRPGVRLVRTALSDDVLADLDGPGPRLLLPGRFTAARRSMIEAAVPRERIVVGVTVPLEEVADSFRWAERALDLIAEGIVADTRLTLCEDHLLTLWLMSDPQLIDELARQRLAQLAEMPAAKQKALTETLRVWLESWSTAAEVGNRLHVHPQTVRYRLNQLKESLGERFTDPESRFGLELVLRAQRLRDRAARPGGGRTGRSSQAS